LAVDVTADCDWRSEIEKIWFGIEDFGEFGKKKIEFWFWKALV
jgi:hypothetical protein